MKQAVHKCDLAEQLNFMKELFPEQYRFHPRSWILPEQWAAASEWLEKGGGRRTLIVKPNEGSQGDGILLLKRARDLPAFASAAAVAQRYIPRPLLVDGVKFDMRLYVLVTSVAPLRAYLHHVGLARLATEPYTEPGPSNLSKVYQHLTNYSLNKLSAKFEDAADACFATGHKRTIAPVLEQLRREGYDVDAAWERIKELVRRTLIAMHPRLWEEYTYAAPADDHGSRCFQLLGFDVLLDADGNPHLLEVNNHPSLLCEAPIDDFVKGTVLRDAFLIVKPTKRERSATADPGVDAATLRQERVAAEAAALAKTQFDVVISDDDAADETDIFLSPGLLAAYRDACGVRQGGLSSSKFVRLLRSRGIAAPGSVFTVQDADILFVNVTRATGAKDVHFFELCKALTQIALRLSSGSTPVAAVAALIGRAFGAADSGPA